MAARAPYILLDDQLTHDQRFYEGPIKVITALIPEETPSALAALSDYHKQGFYLAGYCAYELGYCLEPRLSKRLPENRTGPLLQFGVFKSVSDEAPTDMLYSAQAPKLERKADWSFAQYKARFERVMAYLQAGDAYQINLTFPMLGAYAGSAASLYAGFRLRQKGRYGGIISLGDGPEIISLSPELFYRKDGRKMSMRPMKGTRPRAKDARGDAESLAEMRGDIKSRAENLMIVDLLRNDLSRISEVGSVDVPELFALETYPTLHQMTSRVTSTLSDGAGFGDILKALFPCGSVTGAPKIRAMEIIDELEQAPRNAYCGAMGYIDPTGHACFNVAIRTLSLARGRAVYPVGSGLVLDSEAKDEYAECILKADVLAPRPSQIIETFGWQPEQGFINLDEHTARMQKAAKAIGYGFNARAFERALEGLSPTKTAQRIRVALSQDGTFKLEASPLKPISKMRLAISRHVLDSEVQNFAHKISRRDFYDGERERLAHICGADEVLFLNDKSQLCEGSFTSLFIESVKGAPLLTPALSCGLLPGILRAKLLSSGKAQEAEFGLESLKDAKAIYVGNSLRGLMKAELISSKPL